MSFASICRICTYLLLITLGVTSTVAAAGQPKYWLRPQATAASQALSVNLHLAPYHHSEYVSKSAPAGLFSRKETGERKVSLDRGTLLFALFIACLVCIDHLFALGIYSFICIAVKNILVSISMHELFHFLAIKKYNIPHYAFRIDTKGIYFRVAVDNESRFRRVILAGMLGSSLVAIIAVVAGIFCRTESYIILSVINSVFAFSFDDLTQLAKIENFKDAPPRLLRLIKITHIQNLYKMRPTLILIGGYFASGKRLLALKIKDISPASLNKRLKIVGGDNWLLPVDRRKSHRQYPDSKYEIERWRKTVRFAAKGKPILVPVYSHIFRQRLKIPQAMLEQIRQITDPKEELGYKLFHPGNKLNYRPVKYFLSHAYVSNMVKRIIRENVWKEKNIEESVGNVLRGVGERKIRDFLIDPHSEIVIDMETGDILERVKISRGDIIIFECEHALWFKDIRRAADISIFVDADYMHRKEFLLRRRRFGYRYADLDDTAIKAKLEGFLRREQKEAVYSKTKLYADIIVKNNEFLEEAIEETERSFREIGNPKPVNIKAEFENLLPCESNGNHPAKENRCLLAIDSHA